MRRTPATLPAQPCHWTARFPEANRAKAILKEERADRQADLAKRAITRGQS